MISIREARLEDEAVFRGLWEQYLTELHTRFGGEILPTPRTLDFYCGLFDHFTRFGGGVCLLAERDSLAVGVLLWGSPAESPVDISLGKIAQGWGTYVAPTARGKGISTALREAGAKMLREIGFDSVVGAAEKDNSLGLETGERFGFKITQRVGTLSLRGET